jgi:hypothetical protein
MTLPGYERNLEPDVVRQVNELARQGKLVFPEPNEYCTCGMFCSLSR